MVLEPTATASNDPEHRAGYLIYSIVFGLRGLWPVDVITVHGPHDPDDCVWGDAEVRDVARGVHELVTFHTPQGSGQAARGFRVRDEDGETYPIVRREDRTDPLQEQVEAAFEELRQICASGQGWGWLRVYCSELDRLKRAMRR